MAFVPKQRTEIYARLTARVLAFAPLTSSELGEVVDNVAFGTADQIYELYTEMQSALALLNLDNTTGSELDLKASEYPDLKPRFQNAKATSVAKVTDPNIVKISAIIDLGGANNGDNFLNVDDATLLPASGSVLVGARGSSVFETFNYTSKLGNQLQSTTDTIDFDHGSGEAVVVTTVGDRTYPGPYTVSTEATQQIAAKTYKSTSPLVIFDGEEFGVMNIESNVAGLNGNTPSNTLAKFIGPPPFPGAVVTNEAQITNGQAREKDPDLRQRIRQQTQALSSGNIDAVVSAALNASFQGQRVVFAQVIEDPDPTLPSIDYVDDGSGFVPTQRLFTSPIVLVDAALGGEKRFEIPPEYRPLVTTDMENAVRIFSNITIQKNAVPMAQGDAPAEYRVHPDNGTIRLNTQLSPGDKLEITSIRHFTGLLQEVNWEIYGRRDDRENYPGIAALGSWIQNRVPAAQFVTVQGNVTLDGSRVIDDVVNEVKQNILSYINGLGIGSTVVKNRIIALAFVPGVKDFQLLLPIGDVIIPDGTLARGQSGNITIS